MSKILKYTGYFLFGMQMEAVVFSSMAFNYYENIRKKGGFESKAEMEIFHRKFSHLGFYPFTYLPSIYYGMNYIAIENYVPKIFTHPNYIEEMQKYLKDGEKFL